MTELQKQRTMLELADEIRTAALFINRELAVESTATPDEILGALKGAVGLIGRIDKLYPAITAIHAIRTKGEK